MSEHGADDAPPRLDPRSSRIADALARLQTPRVEPLDGSYGSGAGDGTGPRPSRLRGVLLLLALGVLVTGLIVPLLLGWAAIMLVLHSMVAELLEHARGLERGMFESARLWAFVVNAAALGWCLTRLVRRWREPDRRTWAPVVGLWCIYLLSLAVLLPIDLAGPWDVADPLIAFLLVGAAMLIGPAATALLAVLALRALRAVWRFGRISLAGHARAVAGATVIGLSGLSGSVVLGIGAGTGYLGEPDSEEADEADINAMLAMDREWYVSASGALTSAEGGHRGLARPVSLEDCHAELSGGRMFGEPPLTRAVRRARRKGLDEEAAFELAWDTLVDVCLTHVQSPARDLPAYYGRAIENALNDAHGRRIRTAEIIEFVRESQHRDGDGWGPVPERRRRIRQALELLGAEDRRVIELRAIHGYSHREVARRLRKSEEAAAQAWSRARRRFRTLCEALDCRAAS